jgi:hypothetical protein
MLVETFQVQAHALRIPHTDCPGRANRLNKTRTRLKNGLLADTTPRSSKRAVAARTIGDEASMWMPRESGKFASASMA